MALEAFTDQSPADKLPDALPADEVWSERPMRLTTGPLAAAGCTLALPLTAGGRRGGLIGLGRRWTEEVFDEADLDALEAMAHQAGLALDIARQIRDLRLVPLQVEQAQLDERDRIARGPARYHPTVDAASLRPGARFWAALRRPRPSRAIARRVHSRYRPDRARAARHPARLDAGTSGGRSLEAALQDYASHAQELHGGVQIDLEADPELETLLPPDRRLALLRIFQQALDNALAHAQAHSIRITLHASRDRDTVEFSIVDDGRGFMRCPTGEFIQRGHHGLHVMESRALQCGGRLEIESTPGQGTVVKGYLPGEK